MGQYFMVVNTTKEEYLHPHDFGSGLKFMEFTSDQMSVMTGLASSWATMMTLVYMTRLTSPIKTSHNELSRKCANTHLLKR